MQWGWFKSALIGAGIGLLIAPAVDGALGMTNIALNSEKKADGKQQESTGSLLDGIYFGSKVKVLVNGDVVALAKSEAEGEAAYKAARLAYNAEGVRLLDVDVTFEEADKEKDKETISGMKVLKDEELSKAILESFDDYADTDKELAYTMRIDDYMVTVESMATLVDVLEQAQGQYDTEDRFQVNLVEPESRNVTMYEVGVTEKAASQETSDADEDVSEDDTQKQTEENASEGDEQEQTGEDAASEDSEQEQTEETASEEDKQEQTGEDAASEDSEQEQAEETASEEDEQEQTEEASASGDSEQTQTEEAEQQEAADLATQSADDGVKYIGFSEDIQVMETYVNKNQIKDKDTAYSELTEQNDEPSIYVVESGDNLQYIADINNMTVEQLKELNPGIESDENLYYDDRLNVTVPTAAVQIIVQKQETYEESYNEDVVYEDDGDMYIGETEVVQEGSEGTHVVTDLVTYKNDIETDREQLEESVEVAAVAQIVKRGTKSKPTYMYPVTNWTVTSTFGYRWGRLHAGTDVGVPVGTTVRASRAGQVITAGWVGGYGNCVMIDHGDGVWTVYGHLSEITTSVGSYVNQGDQIALSGNTGRSTGPHLHFEIRVNGTATDATPYLEGTAS
jgi:murein DD-endopeptidase MepM/ murein hydrolase activator NlpD